MASEGSFDDSPGVKWTPTPKPLISIDASRCNGCKDCIKVCLAGVFKLIQKRAQVITLDRCLECAVCFFYLRNQCA